jgi:hypothetical protein
MKRTLSLGIACAALLLVSGNARAASDDAPAAAASSKPKGKAKAPAGTSAKKKAKRKRDTSSGEPDATASAPASKRRRIGASPAYVVGDSSAHFINDAAPPLEAFPTDSKAVKKAFSETRQDQLVDAEKAAREDKTPDRWRTVLFALRGLPERTDPEACFWRVLSFYRLGEIARARTLRENCELPPKDSAVLNGEDAAASGVPAMGTIAMDDGFAPAAATGAAGGAAGKPAPPSSAPYTGPSPQPRK